MTLTPRPYQRECIDDIRARWRAGAVRVPVVLATGLGKSFVAATLAHEWMCDNPGKRVLSIAHTVELVDQMIEEMREVSPHRRVGAMMGARNHSTAEIIVASRQTLASERRRAQLRNIGMIIIDECHLATVAYKRLLHQLDAMGFCEECGGDGCEACNHVGQWRPSVVVLGLTATLARTDRTKLSSIWEECTFTRDILFGIRNGYLSDIQGERIVVEGLDVRHVKRSGGDYNETALAEELERTFAVETIAAEYVRLASDRKGIAFWPLVDTAEHAAKAFEAAGIPSGVVSGRTDKAERRRLIGALKTGEIQVLHNAMVLTAGFNEPSIEAVVIGRPTRSAVLYTQMAGRGLRTPPGVPREKRRPMMLIDPVGASDENSLRLLLDLSPERAARVGELRDDVLLSEYEEELAAIVEADLEEKRAGASFEFESDEYRGPVTSKTFDPLGRASAWGKTRAGIPFMKAGGDAFVFVVEVLPGRHDVVLCSASARVPGAWGRKIDGDLPFTEAVELAETEAFDHGGRGAKLLVSRKHAWRKKDPGSGLVARAAAAGILAESIRTMNAGELSEAVDQVQASHRIDAIVARIPRHVQ